MPPAADPWRELLHHACLAPSPHNVQPWRIRILGPTDAELWIEQSRTLPHEDVTGSFIILTMGLFLETLRIVAAHRGWLVDESPDHEPEWYSAEHLRAVGGARVRFARLQLRRGANDARAVIPLDLLEHRRTSRLPYGPEPVSDAERQSFDTLVTPWRQHYAQTTDPAVIEALLALNIDAVFADLNHAPYRDEMGGWIRYSKTASDRHGDGLDSGCMNVSPPELWLTFHAPWLLRLPTTGPWFRARYRRQIGPVATMGFLCGPFWEPRDAYVAGAALMRFWLECTRLGWYLHPYGNLVTNRDAAAAVARRTDLTDAWLVFKIGRSAPPRRSRRRSVQEILLA